jgi:tetratricopeptide (TPR) repeat protein
MSVFSKHPYRKLWLTLWALAEIAAVGASISSAEASPLGPCSGLAGDDDGLAACTKAIDAGTWKGPDLAAAYMARGEAYFDRVDLNPALADFDRALDADPFYAAAYDGRGRFFRFYPARAAIEFSEAIRLDPTNATYRANRAAAYLAAGDFDRALADADAAIQLEPGNAAAYRVRGNIERAKGDLDRAITDLSEAIRLAPDNKYIYFDRGAAYQAKGDLDRALGDYDQTIKLGPFTHAYVVRGGARLAKGDRTGAIRDYDEAIRRSPDIPVNAEAYLGRAAARQADGDTAGAAADLARAKRLSTIAGLDIPTFTALHETIGLIAILSGLAVVIGMFGAWRMAAVTALFFATTTLTGLSGILFHGVSLDPAFQAGIVSLVFIAIALVARYVGRLAGHWRWVYVISVVAALYLNVYVSLWQMLFKLPSALVLLSRQAEPPFLEIQLALIAVFIALCVIALRTYRPRGETPALAATP